MIAVANPPTPHAAARRRPENLFVWKHAVRSLVRSLAGSLYDRRASRMLQQELAVAYIKSRAAYNGSVAATKVRPLNDNKADRRLPLTERTF